MTNGRILSLIASIAGAGILSASWPFKTPLMWQLFQSLATALLTVLGITFSILLLALNLGRPHSRVVPSQTLDTLSVAYLSLYLATVAWLFEFSYFLQAETSASRYCVEFPQVYCLGIVSTGRLAVFFTFMLVFLLLPFLHRTFQRISPPGLFIVLAKSLGKTRGHASSRGLDLFFKYLVTFADDRDIVAVKTGLLVLEPPSWNCPAQGQACCRFQK
jgi:hypothetical protein